MGKRICSIEGCDKPSRSNPAGWCEKHYMRWYRHGDPLKLVEPLPLVRYRSVNRSGHPIAPASGRVHVHRLVLFDKVGPGSHPCHWCGRTVTWCVDLEGDHVNGDRTDNRPENLVVSCRPCNCNRANVATVARRKREGFWSNHDTQKRPPSR